MTDIEYRRRTAPGEDIDEILRLNREWWESNIGYVIPRMTQVFPSPGEEYLMFNFNGHPYFNMREKVALWEHYRATEDFVGKPDVRIMRLEVRGDTAWLACEARIDEIALADGAPDPGTQNTLLIRATEIYHRDNGEGLPQWRMWHTHISPLPPADEPRPSFTDTTEERGLGWVPWQPLPEREA
ncbi:nuclear transport factor 2 family protein [Streptosporangium sp. NPDC051023]|uniref:nuclear transport factor 2 family protein n=1 Tax=Streptosporangium sp. NPDC051023 TaxID=3155410 RepID=UPI00344B6619